jgi:hypothetical protein
MTTHYVLYIEHDNRPHAVSVHGDQLDAEDALREFGKYLLTGNFDPLPADEDLVRVLAEFNEYARIYRCTLSGSVEIDPFLTPPGRSEAA